MENLSNLSERLKELMADHSIKSESLAREAGIAGSAIRSYLRGQSVPTLANAVKLADYFHCSLDFLAGVSNKDEEVAPRLLPPFYENLRAVMEARGLTRYEVTNHSDIKDAYFTNWAKGQEPLLVTLCTLAKHLNVSLDYLVGRTDY